MADYAWIYWKWYINWGCWDSFGQKYSIKNCWYLRAFFFVFCLFIYSFLTIYKQEKHVNFIDFIRATFWVKTVSIPSIYILSKITNEKSSIFTTVRKSSFYILLKLFNTWQNNFVLLPTNFFIFDSAGIIHTDQLLWSNVTYRKLLLTFLLFLINQKWFYLFFFFYLVTCNNPMLFLYVMLHALILYLPFFTCLVLLISIIPSQRCNTVTFSVTS